MEALNILTVDVEDWFHVLEVERGYAIGDWDDLESRVARNTERLLGLFAEVGVRATFFVVGWVAQREPALVRRIAEAGHELASHSFSHEVVARHSRASLAADLGRSRKLLEDIAGVAVRGFRAPGNSITPATAWALDVIQEQGFRYDASLCPGYSSHGGFDAALLGPHRLRCSGGELVEIPVSTLRLGTWRVPYAGGGYLRLFPYPLIRAAVAHGARAGRPTTVYVHPREIDPDQPRMALPALRRFKYYVGLDGTERKLRALLRDHSFLPAGQWIDRHGARLAECTLDVRQIVAVNPPPPEPRLAPLRPPAVSASQGGTPD